MPRVTNVNGSDLVSNSRPTINTNFSNLDNAITGRGITTIGFSAGYDYVCTGTNDHITIQTALNALTTGGGLLFGPGTYSISGTMQIKYSNTTIKGSGQGVTVFGLTGG